MELSDLISHDIEEILADLDTSDRHSVYEDYYDFQLFIIRRMKFASESLGFQSEGFLFKDNHIYKYNRDTRQLKKLPNGFAELLVDLETYYDQNQNILNSYSKEVENLEEFLFSRNIPSYFMDLWFDIKKDLSKVENFYFRNELVYREFLKKTEKNIVGFKDEYKDIEENIQYQSTYLSTLQSRVESIHNYFESIKNDRLNKTLLTLTIISGVFLPLNLIVGFFGMNTGGLPFLNDIEGTEKVSFILLAVLLICLLGGKVLHVIDTYILRYILGRYDFYQNIIRRANEFEQRIKGK